MVARLNVGKRMLTILNYNENKVKEGVAKCIDENTFGCPPDRLSFNQKIKGFERFTKHNRRAYATAVHISLNFHPDERLSESTLKSIAADYLEKLGFSSQPYLIYQHLDAGHPHLHVVTTNIDIAGNRINLFRIGKYESEAARNFVEDKYRLVKAKGRKTEEEELSHIERLNYGKSAIKRTISNTVRSVIKSYRFTSLPELNAVLRQFNVVADRGTENSRMFKNNGLKYGALNDKGEKIGVAIKASTIFSKPTLKFLQRQFKLNEGLRRRHRERLISCIDRVFEGRNTVTRSAFVQALAKEHVAVLFRQNDEDRIYGITFIDHNTKVVFNGSDLGKSYGAKAITDRLTNLGSKQSDSFTPFPEGLHEVASTDHGFEKLLGDLTQAKQFDFSSPDSAMKRRRRKRRKGRSI